MLAWMLFNMSGYYVQHCWKTSDQEGMHTLGWMGKGGATYMHIQLCDNGGSWKPKPSCSHFARIHMSLCYVFKRTYIQMSMETQPEWWYIWWWKIEIREDSGLKRCWARRGQKLFPQCTFCPHLFGSHIFSVSVKGVMCVYSTAIHT